MSDIDDGIFGDIDFDEFEEVVEKDTSRARKPYQEITVRPPTRSEALGSVESIFDEFELPPVTPLSEIYVTQEQIRQLIGSIGRKSVSLFTGCGGSLTGFAWAGWEDIMSVEFVKAARETLSANYNTFIIEPEIVLVHADKIAQEMGIPRYDTKVAQEEIPTDQGYLIVNKKRTVKKTQIPPSVNWEISLISIGGDRANEFRRSTCESVFEYFRATLPADSGAPIWGDDIRALDPAVAMRFLGIERGELDCLEGSPPCKSFSMSGIREKGWGTVLKYSDERDQRTDDLFMEYLRFLDGFYPKSFVAENVAGIGMGEAESGVMRPLLNAFDELGYHVQAKVMNSDEHSVPQSRPRMIFVGIRKDVVNPATGHSAEFRWPAPAEAKYSCQDALNLAEPFNTPEDIKAQSLEKYECGKAWHELPEGGSPENKMYQMIRCHSKLPVPTITATSAGNIPSAGPCHPHECRKFTIPEYKALFSFPQDYVFTGTVEQQGERMGRSVTPHMMKRIADAIGYTLSLAGTE